MRNAKRDKRARARQAGRIKTGLIAESFSALLSTNKGKVKRPSHGASPPGRHKACAHLSKVAEGKIGSKVKPSIGEDNLGKFRLDSPAYVPRQSHVKFEPKKVR